jgi:hypothetical protein
MERDTRYRVVRAFDGPEPLAVRRGTPADPQGFPLVAG